MENSFIFKGSQSFTIKNNWISKALIELENNPNENIFSKSKGVTYLGIGSNMVVSLKYWLETAGIINTKKKKIELTSFGELIKKNDLYLEKILSWELIHVNLVQNSQGSPLFGVLFNRLPISNSFSKESFIDETKKFFYERQKDNVKLEYLEDDFSVLVRSYLKGKKEDPEDNTECPLSRLCLLKQEEKDEYIKESISLKDLSPFVVYYLLRQTSKNKDSIAFEDSIEQMNGPCKTFNLDRNSFMSILNWLNNNKYISLVKTAGLNTIYLNKKGYSLDQIYKDDSEVSK